MKIRLSACLLTVFLVIGRAQNTDEAAMKRFIDVYRILEQNTQPIPINVDQAFYQGIIPGMLRHLDPHSSFFDPDQYGQLKQMETSTRKGLRDRRLHSARPRAGAADSAEYALRQSRHDAGR